MNSGPIPMTALLLVALLILCVLAGLVVFGLVAWLSGRRRSAAGDPLADLSVDVAQLPVGGPQPAGPHLEVYGVPVRLAVLVLAPVGREGQLPPDELLPALLEQVIPNLSHVVNRDQPIFRRWPSQLSVQGFKHAFCNHVPLPGDRGKQTPWCSLSGKVAALHHQYLLGLVACGGQANGLSEIFVEHEGQWLDIARVRQES